VERPESHGATAQLDFSLTHEDRIVNTASMIGAVETKGDFATVAGKTIGTRKKDLGRKKEELRSLRRKKTLAGPERESSKKMEGERSVKKPQNRRSIKHSKKRKPVLAQKGSSEVGGNSSSTRGVLRKRSRETGPLELTKGSWDRIETQARGALLKSDPNAPKCETEFSKNEGTIFILG